MRLLSEAVSFRRSPVGIAAYEYTVYTRPHGSEMMRTRYEELKDDIFDRYVISFSADNGKTWADTQEWEAGKKLPEGMLRRFFGVGGLPDPKTGRFIIMGDEGVLRHDQPLDGMTQYYPIY